MRKMGIGLGVGINRSNYAQGIFNAYSARVVADGGVVESGTCVDAVSSLLQSASLLLIPSGYKGGKLYSEIPTNGNGDLTWTRGSDAFRTNASGVLQRVPWNLLQQSETFENASWSKANTTISSNVITAPNGTLTADKLVATSSNSVHLAYQQLSVQIQTYTFSVYAKKGEYDYIILRLDNDIATIRTWFNLSNGTIGTSQGGSPTIQNVGDGWYRCTMTYSSPSVQNIFGVVLNANADNVQTFVGNGTSGIFIWGAQLVEGTTAQTYLPTTDRLNFPRLSYMYGSCPSALLEPQRTNLATYSNTFTDASYTTGNTTVTANSTTSPDGSQNATTLTDNTTASFHNISKSISSTISSNYTFSIYAKKKDLNFILMGTIGMGTGYTYFNVSNGTIGDTLATHTPKIESIGNGWYKCSISGIATASSVIIYIGLSNTNGVINYAGTNQGNYIYGLQAEQGAYPTTYIPTTSATATRVADSFSRSNIYTNGLISASGGTWFVELRNNVAYVRDATGGIYLSDTPLGNGWVLRNNQTTASRLTISKVVSGVLTGLFTPTTDTVKIGIKWNGTTADIFVNGVKEISATSFTITAMEYFSTSVQQPVFIQKMSLHPEPLTDAKLIELTTL